MISLNQHKKNIIKWVLYSLLLFIAFILQTSIAMFRIFGVKPILILPVILCVSMFENEWSSAFFGIIGGLFWDTAADKLLGFNAAILLFLTVATALLTMYLIRANFWNALLIVTVGTLLQGLIDYCFCYLIWGEEHTSLLLLKNILPTALYTILLTPVFFFLIRKIAHSFQEE